MNGTAFAHGVNESIRWRRIWITNKRKWNWMDRARVCIGISKMLASIGHDSIGHALKSATLGRLRSVVSQSRSDRAAVLMHLSSCRSDTVWMWIFECGLGGGRRRRRRRDSAFCASAHGQSCIDNQFVDSAHQRPTVLVRSAYPCAFRTMCNWWKHRCLVAKHAVWQR